MSGNRPDSDDTLRCSCLEFDAGDKRGVEATRAVAFQTPPQQKSYGYRRLRWEDLPVGSPREDVPQRFGHVLGPGRLLATVRIEDANRRVPVRKRQIPPFQVLAFERSLVGKHLLFDLTAVGGRGLILYAMTTR